MKEKEEQLESGHTFKIERDWFMQIPITVRKGVGLTGGKTATILCTLAPIYLYSFFIRLPVKNLKKKMKNT